MARKASAQREYTNRVAENIRNARLERGLTQAQLAKKLGIHVEQISRWENGATQLMLHSAWKIAEQLDYNLDDLFL